PAGAAATRLGRPSWPGAGTTVTAKPDPASLDASRSAMRCSPAAPGTSPGFTLSIDTSSDNSPTASSPTPLVGHLLSAGSADMHESSAATRERHQGRARRGPTSGGSRQRRCGQPVRAVMLFDVATHLDEV